MGTALQALVGVGLARRVVGFPTALDQGRNVAAFLVLGGPVSFLIGATWGSRACSLAGSSRGPLGSCIGGLGGLGIRSEHSW